MRALLRHSLIMLSLFIAGCAGPITHPPFPDKTAIEAEQIEQALLALHHRKQDAARLHGIAWKLLYANAPLCGQTRNAYGIRAWNLSDLPKIYRDAAADKYALSEALQVEGAPAGSPAAEAGLKQGDIITAINGEAAPSGKGAPAKFRALMRTFDGDEITLDIRRGEKAKTVKMAGATLCDYGIVYMDQLEIDAHADGRDIFVSRGLMEFTPNDDELAMVVAHELGHNKLHHTRHKLSNSIMGAIGGGLVDAVLAAGGVFTGGGFAVAGANINATAYSLDFEREADYLALYFMARAGYDTKKAANFWRRMAIESSVFIERPSTHPNTAERYLAMMLTHEEIMAKKKAGEPLMPNLQIRESD